jgi:Phage QLRG family, putative DNA packaging.
LSDVKAHLNISADDTTDDEELRGLILSACAVVEDIVGVVAARTFTETASGGDRYVALERSPVISVTSVTVDGQVVDPGAYTVSPSGLLAYRSGAWPDGFRNVEVVYIAGRDVPPANVVDATKELIRINWRPQQGGNYSAFDGGGSDDFGVPASVEASLQGQLRLGFFVPNTVVQRLQPDRRGPVVL